jgi:hypothetical protein
MGFMYIITSTQQVGALVRAKLGGTQITKPSTEAEDLNPETGSTLS